MGAAAQLIPAVATGPLIGAWLDRVEARRPLIVWTQLIRAALLLAVVAVGELGDPPAAVTSCCWPASGSPSRCPIPASGRWCR